MLLACRDCGQIHTVDPDLPPHHRLSCVRCGRDMLRIAPGGFERPLAYALTAFVLFLLANTYPIFVVDFEGDQNSDLLASGPLQLLQYGGALAGLGVLVAVFSIIVPALRLTLMLVVLWALHFRPIGPNGPRFVGFGPSRPRLAAAWKGATTLAPWSMPDVYLLGAFVAYTRLAKIVHTTIGAGGYALAALVIAHALLIFSLGRGRVWDALGDPRAYLPRPGEPWVQCPDCELILGGFDTGAGGGTGGRAIRPGRCPRCGTRLAPRRPGSLAISAALTATALILYFPANLLPVMTVFYLGSQNTNTILSGVRELATAGLWPLAVLVFFASILVPVLKLVSISWFLLAIRRRSARRLRQRTMLYRLIDFVGRWSNIDVFMISILVALLRFGNLTTVDPGTGAVSFAAVVVMTMLATRIFDPRLMWDAAKGPA